MQNKGHFSGSWAVRTITSLQLYPTTAEGESMKGPFGAAVLLLPVMPISLPAQQHFPTNEDLRHLRTISSPQLSPDLKQVVVTLQDSTADGGRTSLWLLNNDGSPDPQLNIKQELY